jgi:hypothetical protein
MAAVMIPYQGVKVIKNVVSVITQSTSLLLCTRGLFAAVEDLIRKCLEIFFNKRHNECL